MAAVASLTLISLCRPHRGICPVHSALSVPMAPACFRPPSSLPATGAGKLQSALHDGHLAWAWGKDPSGLSGLTGPRIGTSGAAERTGQGAFLCAGHPPELPPCSLPSKQGLGVLRKGGPRHNTSSPCLHWLRLLGQMEADLSLQVGSADTTIISYVWQEGKLSSGHSCSRDSAAPGAPVLPRGLAGKLEAKGPEPSWTHLPAQQKWVTKEGRPLVPDGFQAWALTLALLQPGARLSLSSAKTRMRPRRAPEGCCVELLLLLVAAGLPLGGGCPRDCVCYPAPMTVSCQAHNFAAIPEGIPVDSERVFLQNNRIGLLQPGHFSPAMVTLWIYSNNITYIHPSTFEGFVHLEELDLGDNRQLRTLAPETFQGLVKLHALYLYKCGLSALPAGIFGGLHSLQYLYLQDNHIEYLQDDIFVDLVNLSHLFLHGNKLWSLGPGTFRGLVNLDRLLLHENQLQWVHHKAFHDLRRLTTLFLFNNSLSELQGECLAPLGALEFLRLNGNPWDCGCRARSLWEWLQRFRGSSSAVPCLSPGLRHGQDLKLLRAEDFRNCTGPASPHQIKSHTLTTTDRAARKEHHSPHGPTRSKGHPHGHPPGSRSGHRKPGKNCTSHRNRNQISKAGAGKQAPDLPDYAPDYQHKFSFDIMPTARPKRKGKCARRTPIRAPSGVQQASSASSLGASLLAWTLGLAVSLR
ncbi:PREDICTED: reticulon-4 receptor-like 1 [Colobus angolensis palliatus]|uniref:reticulon-4 receptor-like 1 n=1 Tax=Colobus angolensis palliatus TaxID=336983 RepID=UPI0005F43990|nr:PREDICTED: reticulon-4 receptor-like 1 [Colobus angolensis palliatus]